MPNPETAKAASDMLWDHWQQGCRMAGLPDALRPETRAEGYAIQAHLEARSARPPHGWKIAATSAGGQAHIGVDGPMAGRILAERVAAPGATIALGTNHMRVAEAEFAFRLGRDLPPRAAPYSVDEVLDAVASLHPAIELPDSRFDDFVTAGAPQLIADNACAHWFVFGPAAVTDWRGLDLAAHRVVCRVAGRYKRAGSGANVLGDPRIALAWLVNELSGLGISARVGQLISTGTCTVPLEIAPGDEVTADLGALGAVSVRIG